jgi:hypothetical protein
LAIITLPAAALAAANQIRFEMVRSQVSLPTIAGVTQITSFPDRRWMAQIEVVPQFGSQLRAWALALDQLSDKSNAFALTPPYYEGPSTGYAGSNPLVMGADQLGLSLDVDGLPNSTAIALAGDFVSFDVTSAKGNANRELNKLAANLTSNGSGQATMSLVFPIRQAPADDATVNVLTPSAYFMLTDPRSSVDYQLAKFSTFTISAEERIYP